MRGLAKWYRHFIRFILENNSPRRWEMTLLLRWINEGCTPHFTCTLASMTGERVCEMERKKISSNSKAFKRRRRTRMAKDSVWMKMKMIANRDEKGRKMPFRNWLLFASCNWGASRLVHNKRASFMICLEKADKMFCKTRSEILYSWRKRPQIRQPKRAVMF